MRISLISLFLLITSVAIMLWGLGKAVYYQQVVSQATLFVPKIAFNEIAVTALDVDDFVISVGGNSYARVSIIEKSPKGTTTLQQSMKQGKFTVHILQPTSDSQVSTIGFWLDGKEFKADKLHLNQIRFATNLSGILQNGQQIAIMEATDHSTTPPTTYSIIIESLNVAHAHLKANSTPAP